MAVGRGYGTTAGSHLRASDADRERAVDVLKAGYAEGRLPKDDYDALLGRAYSAPTRGDLELVTAQLPGGGPGLYAEPVRRTNQLAVASLACGLGQLILGPLPTIPAIVLGHVAHHQIRRTGEEGARMATTGLVLGWIGAAFTALVVIGVILLAVAVTRGGVAHTAHAGPGSAG